MDLKQALILIFAGIGGTLGFSLIFRMRKKLIVWSLLGAALTLGVYVLCLATMQHAFFQNLFPALVGALYAEITAKLTKSPATQYLACAIIPLVPGGGLYYTMYHFVTGDLDAFHAQLTQTARVAAGLAVGIMLVSVLMHQLRRHSYRELAKETDG